MLYLDSDDYLYPNCLSEGIGNWKKGDAKAHFYLDLVDEHGARLGAVVPSGHLGRGKNPLKMMRLCGAYCSPPGSGNIYSRDFLEKILPAENGTEFQRFGPSHFGSDSIPILAAPYFGIVGAIPRILGSYRRHIEARGGVASTFQREASLNILEREHQKDFVRDHAWRIAARQTDSSRLVDPPRLKRRLCYLRLAGRGLEAADSRLNLFVKGVTSSIWWDGYFWVQKITISGWFLGMAVLPLKLAEKLIRPALGISDRSLGLRKFLRMDKSSKKLRSFARINWP